MVDVMPDKIKVICNKCGAVNTLSVDQCEEYMCFNCASPINIKESIVKGKESSVERDMYELKNLVYSREDYTKKLEYCIYKRINNDLVTYLQLKQSKVYEFSFLNEDSEYFDVIINDIIRTSDYTDEEKIAIINGINPKKKEIYINAIKDELYYLKESEEIIESTYNLGVNIVKAVPKPDNDMSNVKLGIGILLILVVFLFGLFFDKELGAPIVIILSIIPAILIGVNGARLLKINKMSKVLVGFVFVIVGFFIISYIEALRFNGFVSLSKHFDSIIHSVPNFIDILSERFNAPDNPEPVEPPKEEAK